MIIYREAVRKLGPEDHEHLKHARNILTDSKNTEIGLALTEFCAIQIMDLRERNDHAQMDEYKINQGKIAAYKNIIDTLDFKETYAAAMSSRQRK